jgi:hypothetical protein
MRNPLLTVSIALCLVLCAQTSSAVVIFDADFNDQPLGPLAVQAKTDPLPLELPTDVIRDSGCTVDVSASEGDLTEKPVLLGPVAGGLASASFHNPTVSSAGLWTVSWDSLVLDMPVLSSPLQGQVYIIKSNLSDAWGLKYNTDGTFMVEDGTGFKFFGNFRLGIADHFDLMLDLDNDTYDLWINGSSAVSGNVSASADFSHTYFRSNGRESAQDPARFVFDNLTVDFVPEPSTLLLTLAALGVVGGWRKWRRQKFVPIL